MKRLLLLSAVVLLFGVMISGFQYTPASFIDRSGSITTGGTSQQLAPARVDRRRIIIQNPCSATSQGIATAENLFINFEGKSASTSAGNSIELVPCGSFDSAWAASPGVITVNAATSSHQYTAKEM